MSRNYGQPHLTSTMMTGNASHDEGNALCLHNKDPSIDVHSTSIWHKWSDWGSNQCHSQGLCYLGDLLSLCDNNIAATSGFPSKGAVMPVLIHWNGNDILMQFSSLAAPKVVNFRCSQWWKFHQNDNFSASVRVKEHFCSAIPILHFTAHQKTFFFI